MTTEDRARLRRLAKGLALSTRRIPCSHALDAIALWTLLGEPTCLLCGALRIEVSELIFDPPSQVMVLKDGPDEGSVLCSACRSYPKG